MVPYDTYRIYQIERAKSPAESATPNSKRPNSPPLSHRYFVASLGRCAPCGGHPRPQRAACPARPDQPGLYGQPS